MEKNYSYAEFLKAVGRNSSSLQAEKLLNEIYMDLFLKRHSPGTNEERLIGLIDLSLDCRDESAFLMYSKELLKFEEI